LVVILFVAETDGGMSLAVGC